MAGVMDRVKPSSQQPVSSEASPPDESGLSGTSEDGAMDENTEKVVLAGQKLIYSDDYNDTILESLKNGADDAPEAIAHATFVAMQALDEASGGKLPEDAIVPAAIKLLEEVAIIGKESGTVQVDGNTLPQAQQRLVAMAIEAGIIDPQDIQDLIESMDPAEVESMRAEQEAIANGGQQMAGGDPGKPPPPTGVV